MRPEREDVGWRTPTKMIDSSEGEDGEITDDEASKGTEEEDKKGCVEILALEDLSSDDSITLLPTPVKEPPTVITLSDDEDASPAPEANTTEDLELLHLRRTVLEGMLTKENTKPHQGIAGEDNFEPAQMDLSPYDGQLLNENRHPTQSQHYSCPSYHVSEPPSYSRTSLLNHMRPTFSNLLNPMRFPYSSGDITPSAHGIRPPLVLMSGPFSGSQDSEQVTTNVPQDIDDRQAHLGGGASVFPAPMFPSMLPLSTPNVVPLPCAGAMSQFHSLNFPTHDKDPGVDFPEFGQGDKDYRTGVVPSRRYPVQDTDMRRPSVVVCNPVKNSLPQVAEPVSLNFETVHLGTPPHLLTSEKPDYNYGSNSEEHLVRNQRDADRDSTLSSPWFGHNPISLSDDDLIICEPDDVPETVREAGLESESDSNIDKAPPPPPPRIRLAKCQSSSPKPASEGSESSSPVDSSLEEVSTPILSKGTKRPAEEPIDVVRKKLKTNVSTEQASSRESKTNCSVSALRERRSNANVSQSLSTKSKRSVSPFRNSKADLRVSVSPSSDSRRSRNFSPSRNYGTNRKVSPVRNCSTGHKPPTERTNRKVSPEKRNSQTSLLAFRSKYTRRGNASDVSASPPSRHERRSVSPASQRIRKAASSELRNEYILNSVRRSPLILRQTITSSGISDISSSPRTSSGAGSVVQAQSRSPTNSPITTTVSPLPVFWGQRNPNASSAITALPPRSGHTAQPSPPVCVFVPTPVDPPNQIIRHVAPQVQKAPSINHHHVPDAALNQSNKHVGASFVNPSHVPTPIVNFTHNHSPPPLATCEDEEELRARLLIDVSRSRLAKSPIQAHPQNGVSGLMVKVDNAASCARSKFGSSSLTREVYKSSLSTANITKVVKQDITPAMKQTVSFSPRHLLFQRTVLNPLAAKTSPRLPPHQRFRYRNPNSYNVSPKSIQPIIINIRNNDTSSDEESPSRTIHFANKQKQSGKNTGADTLPARHTTPYESKPAISPIAQPRKLSAPSPFLRANQDGSKKQIKVSNASKTPLKPGEAVVHGGESQQSNIGLQPAVSSSSATLIPLSVSASINQLMERAKQTAAKNIQKNNEKESEVRAGNSKNSSLQIPSKTLSNKQEETKKLADELKTLVEVQNTPDPQEPENAAIQREGEPELPSVEMEQESSEPAHPAIAPPDGSVNEAEAAEIQGLSGLFPRVEKSQRERQHKELLLRERLLRSALHRKVQRCKWQRLLRTSESDLVGKRSLLFHLTYNLA